MTYTLHSVRWTLYVYVVICLVHHAETTMNTTSGNVDFLNEPPSAIVNVTIATPKNTSKGENGIGATSIPSSSVNVGHNSEQHIEYPIGQNEGVDGTNDQTNITGGLVKTDSRAFFRSILDSKLNNIRPVQDFRKSLKIFMRFSLYQILEVNEQEQWIKLKMWGEKNWKNEFMYWDPVDYDNISDLILKRTETWIPDTILYNQLDAEIADTGLTATVNTSEPGSSMVSYLFPATYRVSCEMKTRLFPYDVQNCSLSFGSWYHDITILDYYPKDDQILMDHFLPNAEWTILNVSTERYVKKWPCCSPNPYVTLVFHLVIQRKPLYNVVNFIFPTLAIAVITIFGFFTPTNVSGDREEKMSIGLSSLIVMSMFLLIVAAGMPTASDYLPTINIFYLGIIITITMGTLISTSLISFQQRSRFTSFWSNKENVTAGDNSEKLHDCSGSSTVNKINKIIIKKFFKAERDVPGDLRNVTIKRDRLDENFAMTSIGTGEFQSTSAHEDEQNSPILQPENSNIAISTNAAILDEIIIQISSMRRNWTDRIESQKEKQARLLKREASVNFVETVILFAILIVLVIFVIVIFSILLKRNPG